MKRLWLAVALSWGTVAFGQGLGVLGTEPYDLSSLTPEQPVTLGLVNTGEGAVTVDIRAFREATHVPQTQAATGTSLLADAPLAGGAQDYVTLTLPSGTELWEEGYLLVQVTPSGDVPPYTLEKQFISEPVAFDDRLAWASLLGAALLVWLGHDSGKRWVNRLHPRPAANFRWIAGAAEVSFTTSFGSLTTLLLAATNAGLIPAASNLLSPETRPLQVLGLISTIPIILAPMILKLGQRPVRNDEQLIAPAVYSKTPEEKSPIRYYLVGSFVLLAGIWFQILILHQWLKQLDLNTVPGLWEPFQNPNVIAGIIAAVVAIVSVASIAYAVRTLTLQKIQPEAKVASFRTCACCEKPGAKSAGSVTVYTPSPPRPRGKIRNTLF